MNLLERKVVLITGGTGDIGKGIIKLFLEHGAYIAFTYRKFNKINIDSIKTNNLVGFKCNVVSFEETKEMVSKVLERFNKIDLLINNAGIIRDSLLFNMKENDWDDVINANLKSVYNLTKNVIKNMILNKNGNIINISSVIGIVGSKGQSNYSAAKSGIIGFSKSIAKEYASKNIRTNVIAPGFINTNMASKIIKNNKFLNQIPLKKYGKIEDIAYTALFLASNWSSYINGQVISVCGGINI
ncbi:MAG: SDR family oxidoreductase [Bacteroides sp.]|nr:MAG: SDR family oxidoreductase [Bacteroides sp.]